jgi:HD superfamily phosphohydrolase YqeK
MKSANDKIMKFYAKKFHDGKISKKLFSYCIGVRTRCDNIAKNFPFKLKDKLCDVYSLYHEYHPFPPPEVKVKRAEEIALEEIKEWCDQVDFALAMSK